MTEFTCNYVLGDVLAMGSAPPSGTHFRPAFDTLVLCAWEIQPPAAAFPDVRVLRVALDDSGPPPTMTEVRSAIIMGREVARRLRDNRRVLVTCAKGRNRSGLVTGIALIELGMSINGVIFNIRRARGSKALSNRYFVTLLKQYKSYQTTGQVTLSR